MDFNLYYNYNKKKLLNYKIKNDIKKKKKYEKQTNNQTKFLILYILS